MPRTSERAIPARRASRRVWRAGWARAVYAYQRRTAATEPHVPGPGLPKPAPKKVATVQAQYFLPFLFSTGVVEGSVFITVPALSAAEVAEVLEDFRVEDGRADLVDARGPLAEVDLAATVAAEGEIFVADADQHAASGTTEELYVFLL
jgi:hypothetical protein